VDASIQASEDASTHVLNPDLMRPGIPKIEQAQEPAFDRPKRMRNYRIKPKSMRKADESKTPAAEKSIAEATQTRVPAEFADDSYSYASSDDCDADIYGPTDAETYETLKEIQSELGAHDLRLITYYECHGTLSPCTAACKPRHSRRCH